MSLTNAELAELLAVASEDVEGNKQKALRRASRLAYKWPEEAAAIVARGESLTTLAGVGPWVGKAMHGFLDSPPDELPDPPPIRAGFMSFAQALETVDTDRNFRSAFHGDLQMHTGYSDGHESPYDMALKAMELGHEFIAITDHSKGLKIAGGMDEETLAVQGDEIERANEDLADRGFRILKGLEMNISPDGSGDMDADALRSLDLVLGSFHSKLRITEDQTDRYLGAIRNPNVHVLGHPRGRIYNFRKGLTADWDKVFAEAAALDKAVEVDCYPDRQDLNVELLNIAREAGVRISVGTDAHAPWEMEFIELGVATCLDAGIPHDRILNLMSADDIIEWTRSLNG